MTKRVISVRLSDQQLTALDSACSKLGMSRSEAVTAALRLLPKIVGDDAKILHRDTYLRVPWMDSNDEA